MSLLALQRGLRDHLLAERGAEPAGVGPNAGAGLAVYHHAYRAQLIACLRDTYEKTWSWLGDEAFGSAAHAYVESHPPHSWTLAEYGADFPTILAGLYGDDPEVPELAWLDWTLRRAFDGVDAAAISPEALATVDWDNAVLIFVPTLVIGEVASNCAAIWGALAEGETPQSATLLPAPAAIRVWRRDLSPHYRTIEAFEHRALTLAVAGQGFGDICRMLGEDSDPDQTAQRLGGVLAAWLQDGLIHSIG